MHCSSQFVQLLCICELPVGDNQLLLTKNSRYSTCSFSPQLTFLSHNWCFSVTLVQGGGMCTVWKEHYSTFAICSGPFPGQSTWQCIHFPVKDLKKEGRSHAYKWLEIKVVIFPLQTLDICGSSNDWSQECDVTEKWRGKSNVDSWNGIFNLDIEWSYI